MHCLSQNKMSSLRIAFVVVVVAIISVGILWVGVWRELQPSDAALAARAAQRSPDFTLTAEQLFAAYEADELAAKGRYGDAPDRLARLPGLSRAASTPMSRRFWGSWVLLRLGYYWFEELQARVPTGR